MSNRRLKVLFFAESATLAHVARPYMLAASLPSDQFEVHFAADTYFDFVFKEAQFNLHLLSSRSPQDFQKVLENKGILFDAETIRAYVQEEISLIQSVKPDIVVGDLRPSLTISTPTLKVPYVALINAYWSPLTKEVGLPAMISNRVRVRNWWKAWAKITLKREEEEFLKVLPFVFAAQAEGVDTVRKEFNLAPFSDYLSGFTWSNLTLFSDTPDLVDLNPSENCRFIGPVSWSPTVALPAWWTDLPLDKRIVYLSLGSSGPTKLLPALIEVLSGLDVGVIVALAGADRPSSLPANFFVSEYLPGELVLKRASVAITNGGSPSTYQAFQAGVPVLGLPINMDQLLCMRHAQHTGACISLREDLATKATLRKALNDLLNKDSYSTNAKNLQSKLKNYISKDLFTKSLYELADETYPLAANL